MLPSLSRWQRLALALSLSLGYVALHGHAHAAYANVDGDDDDDGGGGGDDGGDKGKGGDDDTGDDPGADDDKDQPPVTAGGLYTLKTYPVRENSRPLTISEGIAQLRLGLGTDLSAKGAFSSFGVNLEGIYGLKDNFELIGGITDAYNFHQFGVYFGFEGALAYDLVDIRLAANLHRNAISKFSNYCSPASASDPDNPDDASKCPAPMAELVNLPNGSTEAGDTKFSIDLGFPFRYSIKPEIAIVALQTLMSIDFNGVNKDHTIQSTDSNGHKTNIKAANSVKPDLNPSVGIATNPIPQLSVVIFAQLRIPDFDTSAGAFQVPVTARVEFSPNQKLDVGLEFTLLNVKPPDGQSAIDNRFLSLFVQSRFGK